MKATEQYKESNITVSWRIQPNLDEATKESEPYIMHLADREDSLTF